jgi:hypothetical protein
MTAYTTTISTVSGSNFYAGPFEEFSKTLDAAIRHLEANPKAKVTIREWERYGGNSGEVTVTREQIRERWGV